MPSANNGIEIILLLNILIVICGIIFLKKYLYIDIVLYFVANKEGIILKFEGIPEEMVLMKQNAQLKRLYYL